MNHENVYRIAGQRHHVGRHGADEFLTNRLYCHIHRARETSRLRCINSSLLGEREMMNRTLCRQVPTPAAETAFGSSDFLLHELVTYEQATLSYYCGTSDAVSRVYVFQS